MNREKIKSDARNIFKDHSVDAIKPILLLVVIEILISIFAKIFNIEAYSILDTSISIITSILLAPLSVGICAYYLKIIRKKKVETVIIFDFYKKKFLFCILVAIISYVLAILGLVLLIIPGIIITIAYTMAFYIIADGCKEDEPKEVLKKSREMMNGYKGDYLVFVLSFIGWFLLIGITFGLASFYVLPYFYLSNALYYDKLKQLKETKKNK